MAQPTNIYILRLQCGKFYIGRSQHPMKRYDEHVRGEGSAWTKKYPPINVERIVSNVSPFEEDRYTKEYMSQYGIENVRGGAYCDVELDDFQVEALQIEIWGANNKCIRCGRGGHFVKDCYASKDVNGLWITTSQSDSDSEYDSEDYVWACRKCDKEFSDEDICDKHESRCRGNYLVVTPPITHPATTTTQCYSCGKLGHYARDCN